MSIVEIKWAITSSLDKLSEKGLQEILALLQILESEHAAVESIHKHSEKVMKEDASLLNRLAQ